MNKVMLIGNVGKEPDVKYYDTDQCVAIVSLATTERGYTLQNGTQVPDHTDWHTIVFWKNLAKVVERYVHKGDKLYVEGKIRYRTEDDAKGRRKYITEILASNLELLSPKPQRTPQDSNTTADQTTAAQTGAMTTDPTKLPF